MITKTISAKHLKIGMKIENESTATKIVKDFGKQTVKVYFDDGDSNSYSFKENVTIVIGDI